MPTHHDARARIDTLTRDLLAFYSDAWSRIEREEQQIRDDWLTWPRPRRLARLQQLQATVEHLMDHADSQSFSFVTGELPQLYHFGAVDSGYPPVQWSKVDIDAVNHLASTTYDNLLSATKYVRRATKTLVRTLTREQIAVKLLTGQTAREAGRELADVFARRGIAAVTYANGTRVGLAGYSQMVVRTQSALAYNQGNFNQYAANDISYVECFDSESCGLSDHDDDEKPNGQVYELSVMEEFPIGHPQCIRGWGARPDVASAEEAASATGSASDAQNADQAALAG